MSRFSWKSKSGKSLTVDDLSEEHVKDSLDSLLVKITSGMVTKKALLHLELAFHKITLEDAKEKQIALLNELDEIIEMLEPTTQGT